MLCKIIYHADMCVISGLISLIYCSTSFEPVGVTSAISMKTLEILTLYYVQTWHQTATAWQELYYYYYATACLTITIQMSNSVSFIVQLQTVCKQMQHGGQRLKGLPGALKLMAYS